MNPRAKFQAIFSVKSSHIQTRSGTFRVNTRTRRAYWIVGRDLCLYHCEDFAHVPRSHRHAALEFKIPIWSPFEHTGYHCMWSGAVAMVWFWDQETVAASSDVRAPPRTKREGRGESHGQVVPETLFYPRKANEVHLQPCREGFELQHWRGNVLAAASWFSQRPDTSQMERFLGRQENDEETWLKELEKTAAVGQARLSRRPWVVPLNYRDWLEANERPLAMLTFLSLLLVAVWQEARIWKVQQLEERTQVELEGHQDRLAPLLRAQDELLALRATNLALLDILGEPSQARLMTLVDEAIPDPAATFREWLYQRPELRVVVADPAPDPIGYVRALEGEPLFEEVNAEPLPGNDGIVITLKVRE